MITLACVGVGHFGFVGSRGGRFVFLHVVAFAGALPRQAGQMAWTVVVVHALICEKVKGCCVAFTA